MAKLSLFINTCLTRINSLFTLYLFFLFLPLKGDINMDVPVCFIICNIVLF